MEFTSYYNLNKPETTDAINIGDINDNMDALDTQMYKHETQLGNLYFGEDDDGKAGWKTSADGEVTPFRSPTGNATSARVLSGYVFSNASGDDYVGTMSNWGSNTATLSSSNTATLSAGYYSSVSINAAGRYSAGYNAGYNAVSLQRSYGFTDVRAGANASQTNSVTVPFDGYAIIVMSSRAGSGGNTVCTFAIDGTTADTITQTSSGISGSTYHRSVSAGQTISMSMSTGADDAYASATFSVSFVWRT